MYTPRSVGLDNTAASPITLFLRNFPSARCKSSSCSAEAQRGNIRVLFDDNPGTIDPQSLTDVGGLLRLRVTAPPTPRARSVRCAVTATDDSASEVLVYFDFAYDAPAPLLLPAEGVSDGGVLVSLTVYGWGSVVQKLSTPDDVQLSLCSQSVPASISSSALSSRSSSLTVTFTAPKCGTVGTSRGVITSADGSASTAFTFTYFTAPRIVSATPNTATLDGRTTEGGVTVLRVVDLPPATVADIAVEFAGIACRQSAACRVTRVVNALGYVDVTVRVPPGAAGEQPVFVTSRGRTAQGSFSYFQPSPEILTVR
jgi:hypothetical protein